MCKVEYLLNEVNLMTEQTWSYCKHPESCLECAYALTAGLPPTPVTPRKPLFSFLRRH